MVIRDYEQEACFILMLWALAIMGFKGYQSWQENNLLNTDILKLPVNLPIGPEDTRALLKRLQELPSHMQRYLLPRALRVR